MKKKKIIGATICVLLTLTIITPIAASKQIDNFQKKIPIPIDVDQSQDDTSTLKFIPGGVKHWQEFIPAKKQHYYIDVHIAQFYGGSPDLFLSIERPLGTILTSASLPASAIPSGTPDWVTFDFPNVDLTKGEKHYIVLYCNVGSEYAWSGAGTNPYTHGRSSDTDPNWDFSFRTYIETKKTDSIPMILQKTLEKNPFLNEIKFLDKTLCKIDLISEFLETHSIIFYRLRTLLNN